MTDPFRIFRRECAALIKSRVREPAGYDFTIPPKRKMGQLGCNVAFQLTRLRKNAPLKIAEEIVAGIDRTAFRLVRDVRAADPGFINFYLDERVYTPLVLDAIRADGDRYGLGDDSPPEAPAATRRSRSQPRTAPTEPTSAASAAAPGRPDTGDAAIPLDPAILATLRELSRDLATPLRDAYERGAAILRQAEQESGRVQSSEERTDPETLGVQQSGRLPPRSPGLQSGEHVMSRQGAGFNPPSHVMSRQGAGFNRPSPVTAAEPAGDAALLTDPAEIELIGVLGRLPDAVRLTRETAEPQLFADYADELAAAAQQFYERCPILHATPPLDPALRRARLILVSATQQVLRNLFRILDLPLSLE